MTHSDLITRADKELVQLAPGAGAPGRRLIRVFPRRTKATPLDAMARSPQKGAILPFPRFVDEADEVHIDVTFTADKPKAEMLADGISAVFETGPHRILERTVKASRPVYVLAIDELARKCREAA